MVTASSTIKIVSLGAFSARAKWARNQYCVTHVVLAVIADGLTRIQRPLSEGNSSEKTKIFPGIK